MFGGLGRNFGRLGSIGSHGSGYLAGNLSGWRTAYANVVAGSADAVVAFLGASALRGFHAGEGATGILNQDQYAWAGPPLVPLLTALGIPTIHNSVVGGNIGANATDAYLNVAGDPLLGGGWDRQTSPNTGFGGQTLFNDTTLTALSVTPKSAADRCIVAWIPAVGRDTVTFDIGGIPFDTQDMNLAVTNKMQFKTLSFTLGTPTINVKRTGIGAGCCIVYFDFFNSAQKRVRILNAGVPGSAFGQFPGQNANFGTIASLKKIAPALTVLVGGGNAVIDGDVIATEQAGMQSIIDACATFGSGNFLFGSHQPVDASASGGEAARRTYTNAFISTCRTNNVPAVDLTYLLGSYASANAKGWTYLDGLHMTATGQAATASAMAPSFK